METRIMTMRYVHHRCYRRLQRLSLKDKKTIEWMLEKIGLDPKF